MPHLRFLPAVLVSSLLALACPAAAQAPDDLPTYGTQKRLTVSVLKLPEAKAATNDFIRRRATRVQKQEETPEQLTAEFSLPTRALPALDSLAATLGFVLENSLNAQNNDQRIQELRDQEVDAQANLARQQAELRGLLAVKTPDSGRLNVQRLTLAVTTSALRRLRQQIATYTTHESLTYVTLRIYDEITFPTANRAVNFVNMPGVEIGLLRLENPQAGVSARFYRGYSVKYLFTRGKSYFNLGIYKPTTKAEPTDSTFITELFLINFGQDFYPRHFGRGQRKFLNLYTTYQIGSVIINR